ATTKSVSGANANDNYSLLIINSASNASGSLHATHASPPPPPLLWELKNNCNKLLYVTLNAFMVLFSFNATDLQYAFVCKGGVA
ncbi:MAG: hypothetical protein LBL41_04520, partial [Bifidobacteriaceae bacterium]|nr:hypothetical protein [Bifidobacteriaceae bacterium]